MRLFVVTFCLLACLSVKALSPSGQNVCRHTRIESYTAQERYYTKCGWFNWRRCTRHRRVFRTRTAVDYRCCSGWNSADNIHCKRAICTGSAPGTCPNGGVCARPTVCTCRRGFGQPNCADTNECLSGNGGCEHQCENTEGSFRCRCSSGYLLAEDGKACTDLDECQANNGGCSQTCSNTEGSFMCSCRDGFVLDEDKKTCRVNLNLRLSRTIRFGPVTTVILNWDSPTQADGIVSQLGYVVEISNLMYNPASVQRTFYPSFGSLLQEKDGETTVRVRAVQENGLSQAAEIVVPAVGEENTTASNPIFAPA